MAPKKDLFGNKAPAIPSHQQPEFWLEFCVVPAEVVLNPKLPPCAGAVYSVVATLAKSPSGCFAKSSYLAALLGLHVASVRRAVQALEEHGYLKRKMMGSNRRTLHIRSGGLRKNRCWVDAAKQRVVKYKIEDANKGLGAQNCAPRCATGAQNCAPSKPIRSQVTDPTPKEIQRDSSGYKYTKDTYEDRHCTSYNVKCAASRDSSSRVIAPKRTAPTKAPANSSRKVSDILRDRSQKKTPSKIVREVKPNPIMTFWNNLPHVRHHMSPASKTYQRTVRALNRLILHGMPKDTYWDEEWLTRSGVPRRRVHRPLSRERIQQAMENISQMCAPGYWPGPDSFLAKMALEDIVYNKRSGKSWLLHAECNIPTEQAREIEDHQYGQQDDEVRTSVDLLERALLQLRGLETSGSSKLRPGETDRLTRIAIKIDEWFHNLPDREFSVLAEFYDTSDKLVQRFVEWLCTTSPDFDSIKPGNLRIDGGLWGDFLDRLGKQLGAKLAVEA